MTERMLATKTPVGMMKVFALLTTPRRFTRVIIARMPSAIPTEYEPAAGNAEVSAAVPAVTETATFST